MAYDIIPMMEKDWKVRADPDAAALIAPFATWMALMCILPSEPRAYAVRTAATLAALVWSWRRLGHPGVALKRALAWGAPVGLLVLLLWVAPEKVFAWYRRYCMYGYTANAPVDTSAWTWKAVRLFGSAFVISVAEELFFRRWLLRYAGFAWMVALFAVEHNRWLAAAITGAIYGWLALRRGLGAAIVAHVVTNLALGAYVLATGDWIFW